ncbi:MAG: hypothetical protein WDN45_14715 [Caulobacteraceae bacterium]
MSRQSISPAGPELTEKNIRSPLAASSAGTWYSSPTTAGMSRVASSSRCTRFHSAWASAGPAKASPARARPAKAGAIPKGLRIPLPNGFF